MLGDQQVTEWRPSRSPALLDFFASNSRWFATTATGNGASVHDPFQGTIGLSASFPALTGNSTSGSHDLDATLASARLCATRSFRQCMQGPLCKGPKP